MKKNIKKTILTITILIVAAVSAFAATTNVSSFNGLKNAFANGGTSTIYKLTADITLSAPIEGSSGKTIVIDLNGYTISCKQYYIEIGKQGASKASDGSSVTIKDTSASGTGQIVATISQRDVNGSRSDARGSLFYVNSWSTLTLDNVDLSASRKDYNASSSSCHVIYGYGSVSIVGNSNISCSWDNISVLDVTTYNSYTSACTIGEGVSVEGNIKLSQKGSLTLNGGSITGNISASNSAPITINGGDVTGNISNSGSGAITVSDGADATITGNITTSSSGKLTINDCEISGNVTASGSGTVIINDGSGIGGNLSNTGSSKMTVYEGATVNGDLKTGTGRNAKVTVEGGDFKGEIDSGRSGSISIKSGNFADDPTDYLESDQFVYRGEQGYSVLSDSPAAIVNDIPYLSLDGALAAAKEGDTVKLYSDITKNVTIDKDIILDLNGKTLEGNISVSDGTSICVIDSDTDGAGLADGLLSAAAGGNLEIESGKFSTDPTAFLADGKFAKYDRMDGIYIVTSPRNSASLTLEGNVVVNLLIDTESYTDDDGAYIVVDYDRQITIKGENLPTTETIYLNGSGYTLDEFNRVKLTVPMGPVQLINSVSIYLYDEDDKLLYAKEDYTATDFCRSVINNASSYSADFVALCKTLLNYGSMTQTYFNAQTGNLPNAGLDIDGDVTSLNTSSWGDYYGEFSSNLPQYVGTSLICNTNMVVRHYFKNPIEDYTITLSSKPDGSGMAITTGYNTTGYYVEVYGIESPYLDSNYTITLTDTETGDIHTITYSPMCYARKTVSRSASKASLVNLCKSIYLYGTAAEEYFIGE